MAFNETEYNLLLNIFGRNEDLISYISSKDVDSFSKYLIGFLNGSIGGVYNLEKETKKIIDLLKNKEISQKTKAFLQNAVIAAYSNIAVKIAK